MQEAIRKGHIHLESNRKSDPIGDPSGPDGPDDRVCKGRAQCGLFVLPLPLQKHPVGHFLRVRGTQEKVDETIAAIKDGSLHVFDTSKFTVTGDNYELTNTQKCKIVTDDEGHVTSAMMVDTDKDWVADSEEGIADGYYHESSYQSAPSFQIRIDGITELN